MLMSGFEIERKFLVRGNDYKRLAYSHSHIKQGYICSGHGRTVRVRQRDDHGFLTIKGPSENGGLSRYEFEKEILMRQSTCSSFACLALLTRRAGLSRVETTSSK